MTDDDALSSLQRYGRFVLLVVFVVLLGGRFTLDRLGAFPAIDPRWAGATLVGFLCLAWAATAREKSDRTPIGPLGGWFVAWAGWLALTAFWAPEGARVLQAPLDLALLVMLVWTSWGVAGRLPVRVLGSVWWWVFIAGLVYFVGAMLGDPDDQGRYSAFGGGPNVFVRVMALAVMASLFLAVVRHKHWPLLAVPLFLYGAYLSGSRGGLLALSVVVLIGGVPLLRRMTSHTRTVLGLAALTAALVGPFLDWSWLGAMRERFVVVTFQQHYDSGRSEILEDALRMFRENPLLGIGVDGFYAITGEAHPHNLIVASATESGLVGVFLLLAALASGAITLRSLRPLNADALGFALAAVFMFVAGMFSGDYYDSRFLWFFLGLAILAAVSGGRREPGRSARRARPSQPRGSSGTGSPRSATASRRSVLR